MKAIIFTIIIAFDVIGALRLKEKQISIRTEEEGKEEQEDIHVHYGNIDIKVIKKKKKENNDKDNRISITNLIRNETLKKDKINDNNTIHIKNLTIVNKIPFNTINKTNTVDEIKEGSNKSVLISPYKASDDEYTVTPRIIHSIDTLNHNANINNQNSINNELTVNKPLYNPIEQKSIVQIKKKIELPILSVIPI